MAAPKASATAAESSPWQTGESVEKVTVVPNPANEESDINRQQPYLNGDRPDTTNANGRDGVQQMDPPNAPRSYARVASTAIDEDNGSSSADTLYKQDDDTHHDRILSRNFSHETEAWEAGGIRFAPLQVPLLRRMQTAAVLFHSMAIILFVSCFWFTCANPLAWPILVPYLIHLSVSTASTDGKLSYRSEYLRSLPLWRLFAGYFPAELHKTHDLPANRKYIFGYHPHGIISHGAFCAFATNALGFASKFPGITNCLLTLDSNFRLPFYRDWILALGIRSVSKESICNILSKGGPNDDGEGRAVTIVIGGARESLEAQPGTLRLILQGRKGFIKIALRMGADLVPVLGFGENDLYDQLSPQTHPMVHKVQMFVLKVFKFTVPALHGRGVLNYDVGLMPYRRPVNIVVGKPIEVDKAYGAHPSQEDIDRVHELYVQELERLWETYKDEFAPTRKAELKFIS